MSPAPRAGIPMTGVGEYAENYPVRLRVEEPSAWNQLPARRLVIEAFNEGGHNSVAIDAFELVAWLRAHLPEVLDPARAAGNELGDLEAKLVAMKIADADAEK